MTSGNKEPVSDRGTGGHSIFAYQLLKALRQNEKPYLSTQKIYTKIAPIVSNNSGHTPFSYLFTQQTSSIERSAV